MPDSNWVERLDPDEREEWDEFVDHWRKDTLTKMVDSAFVASLVPDDPFDVKFALETGAAVLLGKPIVAIVMPGAKVPGKLALVADAVIEADIDTEEGKKMVAAEITRIVKSLEEET
jgi:hypothetical protein